MSGSISHPLYSDRCRQGERGFTLVEILVAISILAIVMTSVYGIFSSVSRARGRLEADSADYHRARVIFDRLGRELRGAYFQRNSTDLVFSGSSIDGGTLQELELTTTAVSPLSQSGTGVTRVVYRLVKDQEDPEDRMVLLRSEQPAYQQASNKADADMMRLATGIEALSLRFFSGGQWFTDWDAKTAGGLPKLVELTMLLGTDERPPVTFRSSFEIPEW